LSRKLQFHSVRKIFKTPVILDFYGKNYTDRFGEQRDQVVLHFRNAPSIVGRAHLPKQVTPDYERLLRRGISEYIDDKGYFMLTHQEIAKIEANPLFADNVAVETPRRWRATAIDEAVSAFKQSLS
jgi:hypothetical protein